MYDIRDREAIKDSAACQNIENTVKIFKNIFPVDDRLVKISAKHKPNDSRSEKFEQF